MTAIPGDPKAIIEAALRFEEEGHRILSDAKEKATHPLSKATFQFLADQELQHIEVIKSFAASIASDGGFDAASIGSPITKRQAGEEIKGIFAGFESQFAAVAGKDEERLDAYTVAMDMESHGHEFYQKASESAADETARKLYEFLAREEIKHFEIIQDTRDFLRQPDAFMAMEEHWMIS